jgi:hypothetical protein
VATEDAIVSGEAPGSRRRRLRLRRQNRHLGPLLEPVLPIDHDLLAGAQAFGNRCAIAFGLGDSHRALLDRVVGFDDEEKAAIGPSLDAARRHGHRVLQRVDLTPHIDEFARPQRLVRIVETGFEMNGAGRRVDLIVDQGQRPFRDLALLALRPGFRRDRTLDLGLANGIELILRRREADEDRLQLGDRHQRGVVAGMDEVADIDLPRAGAAADQRAELRIVEIQLRRLDRGFVGRHRAGQRIGAGAIRVELLARDKFFADQGLVAVGVALCIGELRLVAGKIGLCLGKGRLIRPRIDLEQRGRRPLSPGPL